MLKPTQIPEVPRNIDPNLYRLLAAMRKALLSVHSSVVPPEAVTNLRATAKAGGVIVEFTRSDADGYTLLRNTTNSLNGCVHVDLGNTNRYVDDIGASGVRAFYWVKGKKGTVDGKAAGPVSATTLALDNEITPSQPPPGSRFPAQSELTGEVEPGRPTGTDYRKV